MSVLSSVEKPICLFAPLPFSLSLSSFAWGQIWHEQISILLKIAPFSPSINIHSFCWSLLFTIENYRLWTLSDPSGRFGEFYLPPVSSRFPDWRTDSPTPEPEVWADVCKLLFKVCPFKAQATGYRVDLPAGLGTQRFVALVFYNTLLWSTDQGDMK